MRIGIDLDDTISCTREEINYLFNEYLKNNNINEDDLNRDDIRRFYKNNFKNVLNNVLVKENASYYINKLSKNNEIYIITARSKDFVGYSVDIEEITYYWLNRNNIKYNKVIFNSHYEGKRITCVENKIDLFIDNDIENINWVKSSGIKTILFDDSGKYTGIECITNWKDLYNYINGYK